MLVERADGHWEVARACPMLVPVLSLGRRMLLSEGSGALAGTFALSAPAVAAGGPQLRETCLSSDLFEASAMQAVQKDLMNMLVRELKEELEARDQPKTGNKAWLRRRLHGAIVRARILQSERHREWAPCTPYLEWTLLPVCEIGQTFTILIRV